MRNSANVLNTPGRRSHRALQALYDTNDGHGFVAAVDKYPLPRKLFSTGEGLFPTRPLVTMTAPLRLGESSDPQHYLIASEIASGDELESKRS